MKSNDNDADKLIANTSRAYCVPNTVLKGFMHSYFS
jgi:hypothetical protein